MQKNLVKTLKINNVEKLKITKKLAKTLKIKYSFRFLKKLVKTLKINKVEWSKSLKNVKKSQNI